ncbi:DUF4188 domain-containing protein [Spelaeicoccus albus]|uniref:DUF4188 domain-containing protein n=1 Tax=Spelaeicoccus albus TaxID=1280376 RepID=A0A7Z0ACG8_9MICO|nr:DUF4188 domain-containing protein [Spelaeicoccus albus]NYI67400.1 hypothetical protein [Spelaeicoccus albus]
MRIDRRTHHHDGDLVVFLIGMTINKVWRPDLWMPSFAAMPRMLRELAGERDSGLLGYRYLLEGLNPVVIQYWDSLDKLYAYASNPDAEHRPAWGAFNRRAAKAPNAVGIWHETFSVDRAESVYNGTPPLGLAKFTSSTPISRGNRARSRLAAVRNSAPHPDGSAESAPGP